MTTDKLTIGILGTFQNGKSTLVNCLLGKKIAQTGGYGINVTSINTKYIYDKSPGISLYNHEDIIGQYSLDSFENSDEYPTSVTDVTIAIPSRILKSINILDTLGFNANDHDNIMALNALEHLDAAILLIKNKGLDETERTICQELNSKGKPFFLVMNCMDECDDLWNPNAEQNHKIANDILSDLKLHGISPCSFGGEQIWITNLLWYWFSICNTYYSDVEQKQVKRIGNFFDLFFDSPKPSKNHLKGKSCFVRLNKALQEKKNLCALNLFVALAYNFECYRTMGHRVFDNVFESIPVMISKEVSLLQKSVEHYRMEHVRLGLFHNKQKIDELQTIRRTYQNLIDYLYSINT